jgi:hypothetical protein
LKFGLPSKSSGEETHPVQEALADAAGEHLGRIVDEIRRTIAYFHAQRRQLLPHRIWLMGGGASVRNAAGWFSHECAIPVDNWRLDADGPAGPVPPVDDDGEVQGVSPASPAQIATPRGGSDAFAEPLLAMAIALSALPL